MGYIKQGGTGRERVGNNQHLITYFLVIYIIYFMSSIEKCLFDQQQIFVPLLMIQDLLCNSADSVCGTISLYHSSCYGVYRVSCSIVAMYRFVVFCTMTRVEKSTTKNRGSVKLEVRVHPFYSQNEIYLSQKSFVHFLLHFSVSPNQGQ